MKEKQKNKCNVIHYMRVPYTYGNCHYISITQIRIENVLYIYILYAEIAIVHVILLQIISNHHYDCVLWILFDHLTIIPFKQQIHVITYIIEYFIYFIITIIILMHATFFTHFPSLLLTFLVRFSPAQTFA